MRTRLLIFSTIVVLSFCASFVLPSAVPAQTTPREGSVFPDLSLPLPQKIDERNYLQVEEGPFKLSQVKTEVLIVEIFSMYCPYCQKEAPNVNGLFEALAANPKLKSRVKLIGIGAGNSSFEVNAFRNLYRIEFPLLPDGDLAIHKQLGAVGTPYFFVLRNKAPGRLEVIYSQVGSFGDPAAFLDMIAAKIGPGKKK
ncbi:MAG: TlpA disulfide reductase family protein [Syntrophobacteraceae bacterium]